MDIGKKKHIIDDLFDNNPSSHEDIEKSLRFLKLQKTKAKAELRRIQKEKAFAVLLQIKKKYSNDLEGLKRFSAEILKSKPHYQGLQAAFSNLTELSEADELSILLDAKYLDLLDELEEDLDNLD